MIQIRDLDFFKQFTDEETFSKLKQYQTIPELLKEKKQQDGNLLALSYKNEQVTYSDLYKRCKQVTSFAMKNKKNSHVAILCNNDLSFITTTLGLMCNGLVVTFIPTSLSASEIDSLINKYDIKTLFYSNDFQKTIECLSTTITLVNIAEISNNKPKAFTRKINTTECSRLCVW